MSTSKQRAPMTEEQLAKLAVAREKALVVRRQQKAEKLKAEAARLEATQVEEATTEQQAATPTEEPKQEVETENAPPPQAAPEVVPIVSIAIVYS